MCSGRGGWNLWGGKAQRERPYAEGKGLEFYKRSHLVWLPAPQSLSVWTLGKSVNLFPPVTQLVSAQKTEQGYEGSQGRRERGAREVEGGRAGWEQEWG